MRIATEWFADIDNRMSGTARECSVDLLKDLTQVDPEFVNAIFTPDPFYSSLFSLSLQRVSDGEFLGAKTQQRFLLLATRSLFGPP